MKLIGNDVVRVFGTRRAIAAGLVLACAGQAWGQTRLINISGSSVLDAMLLTPQITNEFIDVNLNGVPFEQAAPTVSGPVAPSVPWVVQIRIGGSPDFREFFGSRELRLWGTTQATGPDSVAGMASSTTAMRYFNRTLVTGATTNPGNAGGMPYTSNLFGALNAFTAPPTGSGGGIFVDAATGDTPSSWREWRPGAPNPSRRPLDAGYGGNLRPAVDKAGVVIASPADINKMVSVFPLNFEYSSPNPGTLYDTPGVRRPVVAMVNFGVGLQQIDVSDLRHLMATGRRASGENLMVSSLTIGSDLRIATATLCMDPSWAVGENVGSALLSTNPTTLLGPSFLPSHRPGLAQIEPVVINHRLGICLTGWERGFSGTSWHTAGRAEVLAVRNDLSGGTVFTRPTCGNVYDTSVNGYRLGSDAVITTIGDPRGAPTSPEIGGDANGNPAPARLATAAFINNITRFGPSNPPPPPPPPCGLSPTSPPWTVAGASGFLPPLALPFLQNPFDPCSWVVNPIFQPSSQANLIGCCLVAPKYVSYGSASISGNGKVPTRFTGAPLVTYSDGVISSQSRYISQGGANLIYGSELSLRNRIAGDFNGDGLRNFNDAFEMVTAWRQRTGGPTWFAPVGSGPIAGAPGTDACIEILGDFNGDGNFSDADVRYWADGLALSPVTGNLDRKAGFTSVDQSLIVLTGNSNFFNTVLATGAPYAFGDSRGDVIGPLGRTTRGWAPTGPDGVVNHHDINYINAQFTGNPFVTGDADWAEFTEAANFDLSCDMDGDLKVNASDPLLAGRGVTVSGDIDEIVRVILKTDYGDVNLDGLIDATDRAIAQANIGNPGGWELGDMDGNGQVSQIDVNIIYSAICPGDLNASGSVNTADLVQFLGLFGSSVTPRDNGDLNGDGQVNTADLVGFLGRFGAAC
ncbi:MAG: dockerin type I domain-containing protein [Phycisphaerales bacterium]